MALDKLSPVQLRLLEMMKWFHEYCEQHQLRYYVVGGTMLGAVRHQGFIPWDDDLDVGLPRADYERLHELMKQDEGRYIIESIHEGNPDYLFPHAKIFDTTTTLVENKKVPVRRGLYIDLFPIDGAGDTLEFAMRHFRPVGLRLDVLATHVCGVREGRSGLKNMAIRVAQSLPEKLYDDNKKMLSIDKSISRIDFDRSNFVANYYGIKRGKEIMKKSWFGTPTLYTFEDMQVYGPENYERYLHRLFGDWRALPPVEQQVTHHDYESCDLEHGWME